jgi:LmbE family N-acetylglucosaminyl deacetylase
LSEELELGPADRVLVVAPHPDDESIGAGGVLQHARARAQALRVIVLTDGDNNPWPQRWIEKRVRIGAPERVRWGARRRAEARAALALLGVEAQDAEFFGLPDLGLMPLLLRADQALAARLRDTLAAFAPTVIVLPALSDGHPDHNAAHVLIRLALGAPAAPRLLTFAVHGRAAARGDRYVELDAAQRAAKQAAIEAHGTQMVFGHRRFVAFATERESFQHVDPMPQPEAAHPLTARREGDTLAVRLDLARWNARWRGQRLALVLDGAQGLRRTLMLAGGTNLAMIDPVTGAAAGAAALRVERDAVHLALPLPAQTTWRQGFVKLAPSKPGLRIFDRYGWQTVAV